MQLLEITMPSATSPPPYTTRLQKGGALLADMRALLLLWSDRSDCVDDLIARNALGHGSRGRARDVITRSFVPRFVRSRPPDLWRAMAVFERANIPRDATLALHFHLAAESEPLLADFALHIHADRGPGSAVTVDDVLRFLRRSPAERFPDGRWSTDVATKVARGLLAALRDFGHLRGTQKKFLAVPALPPLAFAWIAAHRQLLGARGARILRDVAWQRFGLSERAVEHLLFECHANGYVQYHSAGSVVRLDFAAASLEMLAHGLVEGRAGSFGRGASA
jgi:hypothetical protein